MVQLGEKLAFSSKDDVWAPEWAGRVWNEQSSSEFEKITSPFVTHRASLTMAWVGSFSCKKHGWKIENNVIKSKAHFFKDFPNIQNF